jgi:hypothetical protein
VGDNYSSGLTVDPVDCAPCPLWVMSRRWKRQARRSSLADNSLANRLLRGRWCLAGAFRKFDESL